MRLEKHWSKPLKLELPSAPETVRVQAPSSTQSKQSIQVTLMLQQSLKMGFIPNIVYKKEVQRAGKRQSTLDIKRSLNADAF